VHHRVRRVLDAVRSLVGFSLTRCVSHSEGFWTVEPKTTGRL
jgi:hypothetical protein